MTRTFLVTFQTSTHDGKYELTSRTVQSEVKTKYPTTKTISDWEQRYRDIGYYVHVMSYVELSEEE